MLVHHFGSKEQLLSEALALIRARQIEHLAPAHMMPVTSFDQVFHASWERLAADEFRSYFLLNHELLALAIREPRRFEIFLKTTTEEWRSGLAGSLRERGFSEDDACAASTMYMAVLRGLLLDLAVTRDRERVDRALKMVAEKLKADLERRRVSDGRGLQDDQTSAPERMAGGATRRRPKRASRRPSARTSERT